MKIISLAGKRHFAQSFRGRSQATYGHEMYNRITKQTT